MMCVAKAVIARKIKDHGSFIEPRVIVTTFDALLDKVSSDWSRSSEFIVELFTAKWLFIDDMSVRVNTMNNVESSYKWAYEVVKRVVDGFWSRDPGTFGLHITTNNTPAELAEAFSPPVVDRIRGICDTFLIENKSRR